MKNLIWECCVFNFVGSMRIKLLLLNSCSSLLFPLLLFLFIFCGSITNLIANYIFLLTTVHLKERYEGVFKKIPEQRGK